MASRLEVGVESSSLFRVFSLYEPKSEAILDLLSQITDCLKVFFEIMQAIDFMMSAIVTMAVDIVVGTIAFIHFIKYMGSNNKSIPLWSVASIVAVFFAIIGFLYFASLAPGLTSAVGNNLSSVSTSGAVRVSHRGAGLSDMHPLLLFAILIAPTFLSLYIMRAGKGLVRIIVLLIVVPVALLGLGQTYDYFNHLQNPPPLFN